MCIRAKGNDPLTTASSWQCSPTELSTCINLSGCPYFSRATQRCDCGGGLRSRDLWVMSPSSYQLLHSAPIKCRNQGPKRAHPGQSVCSVHRPVSIVAHVAQVDPVRQDRSPELIEPVVAGLRPAALPLGYRDKSALSVTIRHSVQTHTHWVAQGGGPAAQVSSPMLSISRPNTMWVVPTIMPHPGNDPGGSEDNGFTGRPRSLRVYYGLMQCRLELRSIG